MASAQTSLLEFQKSFPDDASCARFLLRQRWPSGFVCPQCGGRRGTALSTRSRTYECLACGRQTSLTAGTIMHRSKLPLTAWFWAAYLLASRANGLAARELQIQLGVSYRTAWLMMQKFRRAMADADPQKLSGAVEIGRSQLPFRSRGGRSIAIVAAVELLDAAREGAAEAGASSMRAGRLRLASLRNGSQAEIEAFIRANVASGSALTGDPGKELDGFRRLRHGGAASQYVPAVFARLKRWSLGTHGGLRRKHVDHYLAEFAFRANRRLLGPLRFELILGLAARHRPVGYWDIVGRGNPRLRKAAPRPGAPAPRPAARRSTRSRRIDPA